MPHAQQQILSALQVLLLAGGTSAGSRVYVDRLDPLEDDGLPAIVIEETDEGESAETYLMHGAERRELAVQINCIVTHGSTYASDARALGLAVEKLVAASSTLAALCRLGHRITSSRLQLSGEGDRALAARQQTWRFVYLVAPTAPDVIL